MDELLAEIEKMLPGDWGLDDTYGLDFTLICSHSHTIEPDGRCPSGCVSPIRGLGII